MDWGRQDKSGAKEEAVVRRYSTPQHQGLKRQHVKIENNFKDQIMLLKRHD